MLTLYRRHLSRCRYTSRKARACACPLWVQGYLEGKYLRRALSVVSWEAGQQKVRELELGVPGSEPVLVADALQKWKNDAEARRLEPSTLRKYRQTADRLQNYCEHRGIRFLSGLTPDELRRFREGWTLSDRTARVEYERLRGFLRFCRSAKWIGDDPLASVRPPKADAKPVLPFTDDEVRRAFDAVDEFPNLGIYGLGSRARIRAFLLVLLHTGLRIGDVVRLRRDALADQSVFLRTTKTGTPVRVPLPKEALEALKAMDGGDYFFWKGEGNVLTAIGNWERTLRKLSKLAGVKVNAHRFRHTFACRLLSLGVPMHDVAVLLGHSIKVCEKSYSAFVKSRSEALEKAVKKSWRVDFS